MIGGRLGVRGNVCGLGEAVGGIVAIPSGTMMMGERGGRMTTGSEPCRLSVDVAIATVIAKPSGAGAPIGTTIAQSSADTVGMGVAINRRIGQQLADVTTIGKAIARSTGAVVGRRMKIVRRVVGTIADLPPDESTIIRMAIALSRVVMLMLMSSSNGAIRGIRVMTGRSTDRTVATTIELCGSVTVGMTNSWGLASAERPSGSP